MKKKSAQNLALGGLNAFRLERKTMNKHSIAVVAVFVFSLVLPVMAAEDPFTGTWKLNVAKSRYGLRQPQKSEILKIDAQQNGLKYVADGVDAEGKNIHFEFSPKYDGKYYPVTGTVAAGSAMALKKINANIRELVLKIEGKDVQRRRDEVSRDGKTLTRTVTAMDTNKQDARDVIVFDRQ
jgi:hypothetical protein